MSTRSMGGLRTLWVWMVGAVCIGLLLGIACIGWLVEWVLA